MLCRVNRCNINFITVFKFGLGTDLQICPRRPTELLGNHSVLDPPDPIPNSEVKRNRADDSVGSPHVKVGHCQALTSKPRTNLVRGFFMLEVI